VAKRCFSSHAVIPNINSLRRVLPRSLIAAVILGAVVRIGVVVIFSHPESSFYFEYGEMAKNVLAGKGLSYVVANQEALAYHFSASTAPLPTAYMSPGYVFFLFPFLALPSVLIANVLLITVQFLLSLVVIVLLYHCASAMFSPRIGLFAALIGAVLPDFAYSVISFAPTIIFHLGIGLLFIVLLKNTTTFSLTRTVWLSLLCAVLTYMRFEFIAYLLALPLIVQPRFRKKEILPAVFATLCMLVPWSVRNYDVFGEMVPLGTGAGINLFRGNNERYLGAWGDSITMATLSAAPKNNRFEIVFDSVYRVRSLDFIWNHPVDDAKMILVKVSQLWLFSSYRLASVNSVYVVSSILLFVLFVVGLVTSWSWKRFKMFYVFLSYSTILAMVFFALPRHQTMMRIAMLPFAGAGLEYVMVRLGIDRRISLSVLKRFDAA